MPDTGDAPDLARPSPPVRPRLPARKRYEDASAATARPARQRPRDRRPGISGIAPGELLAWFAERGEAAFRARQLADHVWSGRATSFDDVHTLPGSLRDRARAMRTASAR